MAEIKDMIKTIETQIESKRKHLDNIEKEITSLRHTGDENKKIADKTRNTLSQITNMNDKLFRAIEDAAILKILQDNIKDQTTILNILTEIIAKDSKMEKSKMREAMDELAHNLSTREQTVHVGDRTNISGGNNINQFGDNATGEQK